MVVGEGPGREKAEAWIPDGVFMGFLAGEDLARAYASADIFFNPSTTEAFGNVTLEAMASGLPTVCFRATGSASIVIDGVTGFLIEPSQDSEAANRLAELIRNEPLRKQMGAESRVKSLAYDWDAVMNSLLDYYRAVVAEWSVSPAQSSSRTSLKRPDLQYGREPGR